MSRRTNLMIIVATIILGIANIVVATRGRGPAQPETSWDHWCKLSAPQRAACVHKYRSLARQPNTNVIMHNAGRFGELPPQRQEYLRQLRHVVDETLATLPEGQRLNLLRLSPRARAFLIYQTLRSDRPQRLDELRNAAEHSR